MSDISMCVVGNCPKARQCYRHVDSGTKPSRLQTMFTPIMDVDEEGKPKGCTYFSPKIRPLHT